MRNKAAVEAFEGDEGDDKLAHAVQEKGSNLSAGTVQLLCLARVLLKKPDVIFMDEAGSVCVRACRVCVRADATRALYW